MENTMMEPMVLNGIAVAALNGFAQCVSEDASLGMAGFGVLTTWQGGTRTRAVTQSLSLGSTELARPFVIEADEPPALLGKDLAPNPQELLLAALNACMTVGYVANAAAMGIEIRGMSIHSRGQLDLRGFLGLDPSVNPGYDTVNVEVSISSNASEEVLHALHAKVRRTSPNYHNFVRAIDLKANLIISQ